MPYRAEELELITIVECLIGQFSLSEQTKLLLEEFPPSLNRAKEYFLHYMEYVALRNQYSGKGVSYEQKKAYEEQLKQLNNKIDKDFTPNNEQEKELMQYLALHFMSKWQFDDKEQLSFKTIRKPNDYWINLDNHMQALAINFAPVALLRAELPTSTRESQRDVYQNGAKAGNLECKIKLADMYLNARMQNLSKEEIEELGIQEQEAIHFIEEGIAKGMPSAIAAMANFVDNWLQASPFMYAPNDRATEAHRTVLAENGRLALALCSDKEIKNGINNLLNLNMHTDNTDAYKKAKTMNAETKKLIPLFAKRLQISTEQAATIGKDLTLKPEFSHIMISLNKEIVIQQAQYEKAFHAAKPDSPNQSLLQKKMQSLQTASKAFTALHYSKDTLTMKTIKALEITEKLNQNTQELPTSNPLKRCINAVIKKLFNKDNFIKSQAYEISQQGHSLLTHFNKQLQKSPAQPEKEAIVEPNLRAKPPTPTHRSPSG